MDRGRGRALAMRESARGVFFSLGGCPSVLTCLSHSEYAPAPAGRGPGGVPDPGCEVMPRASGGCRETPPPGREAGGGDRAGWAGVRPG